jgi:tripartite-type tricarboxylate transporter receptor subunit TctC
VIAGKSVRTDFFLKKILESTIFASAGTGATHLSMACFSNLAGIEMVHIPFKATNEAIRRCSSVGRTQSKATTIGALPFAKDARVVIGVSGAKRCARFAQLPTIAERPLGLGSFRIGLLGPAGIESDRG